jgi:hypothetical protein
MTRYVPNLEDMGKHHRKSPCSGRDGTEEPSHSMPLKKLVLVIFLFTLIEPINFLINLGLTLYHTFDEHLRSLNT